MTIASDLTRIKDAKTAIRQAIIDKGVDVPETEKLDTYYGYIDQIGGSYPEGPLGDFKRAIDDGSAFTKYPPGTEFEDEYGGVSNPLIVAHYYDGNGSYGSKAGAMLMRKYMVTDMAPGTYNNYPNTDVATWLNSGISSGKYRGACSSALNSIVSDVSVPYWDGTATISFTAGVWLMSTTEICGTGVDTHLEGEIFDYFKERIGTPVQSANNYRKFASQSDPSTYVNWWLRSIGNASYRTIVLANGSIYLQGEPSVSRGILPVHFVAKE